MIDHASCDCFSASPLSRCVQLRELATDRGRYMTLIKLLDYQLYPQMIFLATIDTDTNSGEKNGNRIKRF